MDEIIWDLEREKDHEIMTKRTGLASINKKKKNLIIFC